MLYPRRLFLLLVSAPILAYAFGPATPVLSRSHNARRCNNNAVAASNNGNGLVMRVSIGDMARRSKVVRMLDKAVVPGDRVATQEVIATKIVTKETSRIIETMNWKTRDAVLHKVRIIASKYDVPVDKSFGIPPTHEERERMLMATATIKRAERKAYNDKVNAERDAAAAAKRAKEVGSQGEARKIAKMLERQRRALMEAEEAKKREIEAAEKMRRDVDAANKAEMARAAAAELSLAKKKKAATKK